VPFANQGPGVWKKVLIRAPNILLRKKKNEGKGLSAARKSLSQKKGKRDPGRKNRKERTITRAQKK